MKKTTDHSEINKYREAQKRYLDASRSYAAALTEMTELNPRIVSIVRDIHEQGAQISRFDSPTLTSFFNDVSKNSKIDASYKKAYQDLLRTRNALEHAAYNLSEMRINMVLKKAGIVKVKHNKDAFAQVQWVNNPNAGSLERISVALPYLKDEVLKLENYIDKGEVKITSGEIKSSSRDARNFVKQLEVLAIQRVNDNYFGSHQHGPKELYPMVHSGKVTVLELIRDLGDTDHVRELERRIAAGDVTLAKNDLSVLSQKGARYLKLLDEEMRVKLDRLVDDSFYTAHEQAIQNDPLFSQISASVDGLSSGLNKHLERVSKLDFDNSYRELTNKVGLQLDNINSEKESLEADLGHLAKSAVALRKQLLALGYGRQIDAERALPILAGMSMLEMYEDRVNHRLSDFSNRLGLQEYHTQHELKPFSQIYETYSCENDVYGRDKLVSELPARLQSRTQFRDDLAGIVTKFITGSEKYAEYREAVKKEQALTNYLYDYLGSEPRLHRGTAEMSQILGEIIETQVEKEELLAEVIHEIELVHKKLWLADVKKQNNSHIEKNIKPVSGQSAVVARETNSKIISVGEKNVESLLDGFSAKHDLHMNEFLTELAKLSPRIKSGEDASKVALDIKSKYRKYLEAHNEELKVLEIEMKRLDKVLQSLGDKSRKMIEKTLIEDIKKQALS